MMNYVTGTETRLQNQEAILQKRKTQMGKLTNQLTAQAPGSLPSSTEKNPRDVNVIMVVKQAPKEELEEVAKRKKMV